MLTFILVAVGTVLLLAAAPLIARQITNAIAKRVKSETMPVQVEIVQNFRDHDPQRIVDVMAKTTAQLKPPKFAGSVAKNIEEVLADGMPRRGRDIYLALKARGYKGPGPFVYTVLSQNAEPNGTFVRLARGVYTLRKSITNTAEAS